MKTFFLSLAAITMLMALGSGMAAAADGPGYHVVKTYKLGGEGGWDYLTMDSASGRLYISRGTHVVVLDASNGKVEGDIADTPGVHGIALAPKMNKAFTSNGREGTVSMVDMKTLKTMGKVKVGENPDAIVYDPATQHVFTMNGHSQDSSVVDPAQGKVVGTIKLDGKPEFAVSDGNGRIWVNIEDKNEVTEIDAKQMKVLRSWPLTDCEAPSGLSMDQKHRRLFSGCSESKTMAISDVDAGKTIATVPICDGTDATAFDSATGMAFASCHDGHITVVKEDSPNKFHVAETVATEEGARTMTLDTKTDHLYTVTAKFGPRPAPSTDNPHPRPAIMPDSFVVLVVAR
jgi:DNA-binding beta-propeller fold protein YncE